MSNSEDSNNSEIRNIHEDIIYISKEGEKLNSCHKNIENFPGTCRCAANLITGIKKNFQECPRTQKFGIISFRDTETRDIYANNWNIFLKDCSALSPEKIDTNFAGELPFMYIDEVKPLGNAELGISLKVNLRKNPENLRSIT